jgi:hypothetical protein
MNALLACINSGALSGGITDLYDANIRNSVISGSGICRQIIDNCVAQLSVYHSASDVWIDFNSRVIQPQYYNFVLRKTGLTPNQAENTCMLLDKNTYGNSFAAVSAGDALKYEYNKNVQAYNMTNNQTATWGKETDTAVADRPHSNVVTKDNPQGLSGPAAGNPAYDSNRGHYARWDAKAGECLVRIAAYNKDQLISNNWLFGAAGNEKAAEVWKPTGTNFTCNKDLFEFSLLNQTATVAVVGASATVLGTGITALASIPAQKKNTGIFNCDDVSHRKDLRRAIRDHNLEGALNLYLKDKLQSSETELTANDCKAVVDLQDVLQEIKEDPCYRKSGLENSIILSVEANGSVVSASNNTSNGEANPLCDNVKWVSIILSEDRRCKACEEKDGICCVSESITKLEVDRLSNNLAKISDILREGGKEMNKVLRNSLIAAGVGAGATGLATAITAFIEKNNINCRIGDDLKRVAMGKSGNIDSLKNYYVQWDLHLPDTNGPLPSAPVVDCAGWKKACGDIKDDSQCIGAALHYKPAGAAMALMIYNACAWNASAGTCEENHPVAVSHGACQ